MQLNWEQIRTNLDTMGMTYQERTIDDTLSGYIHQCGYCTHPLVVNMDSVDFVDATLGVLVTHVDEHTNNGVYVFVVLRDHTQGLITVIPSTISKGPVLRKVEGDITNAITGISKPAMTPFDLMEVTGQVLANTVMKDILTAFHIPREKEKSFLRIYLPKFLSNVASYYLGVKTKDGKPVVIEEIVDMEPAMIRKVVLGESFPDCFNEEPSPDTTAEQKEADTTTTDSESLDAEPMETTENGKEA